MSKKLVILGAGGYANTFKDVSEQLGYDVIAMLDDRFADRTLDSFTKYIADDTEFIPAFGNNEFRLSEQGCHICLGAIVKGENRIAALSKIEAGEVVQLRQYPVNK